MSVKQNQQQKTDLTTVARPTYYLPYLLVAQHLQQNQLPPSIPGKLKRTLKVTLYSGCRTHKYIHMYLWRATVEMIKVYLHNSKYINVLYIRHVLFFREILVFHSLLEHPKC